VNRIRILTPLTGLLLALIVTGALPASAQSEKAAEVNGAPIFAADVDTKLGNNLAQLQQQIFTLRQKQLDSMIDQKLLEEEAAKRGVTVGALLEAEVTSRVTPVTSQEAEKLYRENAEKLQGDFKTLEPQIKSFLNGQRLQARREEYLKSLRTGGKVSIFLKPPPVFRSEISLEGSPVRGNAAAPVTIVEFSDFHCPFCRKAQSSLASVRSKYNDKVKLSSATSRWIVCIRKRKPRQQRPVAPTSRGNSGSSTTDCFKTPIVLTEQCSALRKNSVWMSRSSRHVRLPASTRRKFSPVWKKVFGWESPRRPPSSSMAGFW